MTFFIGDPFIVNDKVASHIVHVTKGGQYMGCKESLDAAQDWVSHQERLEQATRHAEDCAGSREDRCSCGLYFSA